MTRRRGPHPIVWAVLASIAAWALIIIGGFLAVAAISKITS